MSRLRQGLGKLSLLAGYFPEGLVIALSVLVFVNVLGRNTGIVHLDWTEELAIILLVWLVFIGVWKVERDAEHLTIKAVVTLFPARVQQALYVFSRLVALVIVVFLLVAAWSHLVGVTDTTTQIMHLPVILYPLPVLIAMVVSLIYILKSGIGSLRRWWLKGREE